MKETICRHWVARCPERSVEEIPARGIFHIANHCWKTCLLSFSFLRSPNTIWIGEEATCNLYYSQVTRSMVPKNSAQFSGALLTPRHISDLIADVFLPRQKRVPRTLHQTNWKNVKKCLQGAATRWTTGNKEKLSNSKHVAWPCCCLVSFYFLRAILWLHTVLSLLHDFLSVSKRSSVSESFPIDFQCMTVWSHKYSA